MSSTTTFDTAQLEALTGAVSGSVLLPGTTTATTTRDASTTA